jgi:type IV pilus assembly protein PilM
MALGIDISNEYINLALLKKSGHDISLIKTAASPLPPGIIDDGNIKDAELLVKTIKKLKNKNRIGSHPTAISLVANPVLMQILHLPENRLSNVREFIRDEVKNYAQLPTRQAIIDYCGIKNSDGTGQRRAFIAAADQRKITEALKTFNQKGLSINAIEPACLAYIRTFYSKKIATKYDINLLFAITHNDTITLCLLRNQTLDFIRSIHININSLDKDQFFELLSKEIHTIIQFYEVEVSGKCEPWEVTVAGEIFDDDNHILAQSLNNNVRNVRVDVCPFKNTDQGTDIWQNEKHVKTSPVAIGLAMKLLDYSDFNLKINLMPKEISASKTAEKHTLITANAAAVIFFIFILCLGFLSKKEKQVQENMQYNNNARIISVSKKLLEEQKSTNNDVRYLSNRLKRVNQIRKVRPFIQWEQVFFDLSKKTPRDVQITSLTSKNNNLALEGRALSYEAIHLFVEMLDSSEFIKSAALVRTIDKNTSDDVLRFSINCSL